MEEKIYRIDEDMLELIDRLNLSEVDKSDLLVPASFETIMSKIHKIMAKEEKRYQSFVTELREARKNLKTNLNRLGMSESDLMNQFISNEEYEKADTLLKVDNILNEENPITEYFKDIYGRDTFRKEL